MLKSESTDGAATSYLHYIEQTPTDYEYWKSLPYESLLTPVVEEQKEIRDEGIFVTVEGYGIADVIVYLEQDNLADFRDYLLKWSEVIHVSVWKDWKADYFTLHVKFALHTMKKSEFANKVVSGYKMFKDDFRSPTTNIAFVEGTNDVFYVIIDKAFKQKFIEYVNQFCIFSVVENDGIAVVVKCGEEDLMRKNQAFAFIERYWAFICKTGM